MDLLTQVVAAFETFRSRVYSDPAGKATIGYGHLILPGEDFSDGLTEEQARLLLEKDLGTARRSVDALFRSVYLTDSEWDALTAFIFNVGETEDVRTSALRRYVLKGNGIDAAHEFIRWIHATMPDGTKKVLPGLVRRRDCESVWFLGAHPSTVQRLAGIKQETT
jgi:lysozyme